MLYITPRAYADALALCAMTGYRRLSGLPHAKGPKGQHYHHLARVLPTVRKSEHKNLSNLFASSVQINSTMPDDAEAAVGALEAWFDADARARLALTRRRFCESLADRGGREISDQLLSCSD